jgi:hypothetical protein
VDKDQRGIGDHKGEDMFLWVLSTFARKNVEEVRYWRASD